MILAPTRPAQRSDEMKAFDRLPAMVRQRLTESPFDFSAVRLADDKRCLGLNAKQLVAFIGELETWARTEIGRATGHGSDGNRLDAVTEPDVEAMAKRAIEATARDRCRK